MSYIGNGPEVNYHTLGIERFSGDNTTVAFALTRDVDDSLAIEVHVNNVQQEPTYAYSANNGVITFTEAPSAGSNNITVLYRDTTQVIYNTVSTTQIDAGAVTASKLAEGAVIAAITPNTITSNLIANGAITGNLIANTAIRANQIVAGTITGNLIADTSIRANQIVAGTITGNLIADTSIRGNQIATSTLTGNLFAANTITGDLIGQGAISANNFAPGSVSSTYQNIAYYTQPTSNLQPAQFSFTVPTATTRMKVTIVGGGGGSGSTTTGAPFNTVLGSGGGGAGGTTTAYLAGPFPASPISITVGGGGERGVATPSASPSGSSGGTSTFGPFNFGANTNQTFSAYGGSGSSGIYLGPNTQGFLSFGQGANTFATGQTVGGDYTTFYSSGSPGRATAYYNGSIVGHTGGFQTVGLSEFGGGKGQGALGVVNPGGAVPGANGTPGMVMIEY
jgi:hypothetical protein